MDLNKLRDPFPAEAIEWRIGRCGRGQGNIWATCMAYIANRAIQERLDEICGPENWRNEYREWHGDKAQLCGISIRVKDEWVTKWDGAENTDIEAIKGGLSSAMKRAAVQWGIGRYLYDLDEGFAQIVDKNTKGRIYAKTGEKEGGEVFYWLPPQLPAWALPENKTDGALAASAPTLQQPPDNGRPEGNPLSPSEQKVKAGKAALIDAVKSGEPAKVIAVLKRSDELTEKKEITAAGAAYLKKFLVDHICDQCLMASEDGAIAIMKMSVTLHEDARITEADFKRVDQNVSSRLETLKEALEHQGSY